MYGRVEQVWTEYHKLLGEVELLRANENISRQQVVEGSASNTSEVAKLREKLHEALQERDRAEVLARVEEEAAAYAKRQLDEEHIIIVNLQEGIAHLKSESYQQDIVDKHSREILDTYHQDIIDTYRESLIGKTKVTLACKAGYDHLLAQLPVDLKSIPNRFRYLSMVTNFLGELEELEALGGGFDPDETKEDSDEEQGRSSPPPTTPKSSPPLTP
ncbi:uncharacterized protein A4U43_C03F32210 [Asparagus officinalis]|uniref:Uncharacterized protein n=1 Tax=Asparagus officinalis TaxID=4686 RepID=A0A5P1FFF8_ASPOF|nr:uncharacterized protein A4U43_C03F32210 [Asparagus officinalis]